MKQKFKEYFMNVAQLTANLSYAERLKVGAVLVRDKRILLCGYNGTPPGSDNQLEQDGITKPDVSHAEENLIIYAAKNGISLKDTELFITHSPCPTCSRLIYGSGIKKIYYRECYRDKSGLDFLRKLGIKLEHYAE